MLKQTVPITLTRLQSFSDGVIAIIITLMILEIKIPRFSNDLSSEEIWQQVFKLSPAFIAYVISFAMVGVIWVNHHQFFHQLRQGDRDLLWYNLHLLFWMSLLPIPTAFLGDHYMKPEATALYGANMFFIALAFALMREYVHRHPDLAIENLSAQLRKKLRYKIYTSVILYFISIFTGYMSVYISIGIFVLIPAIYFMPVNVELDTQSS